VPLGKSLHAEPTPFVNSDGRDRTGPGSAGSVQAAYVRLVAIVLNEGDILWSVANGDALRNDPTFKALTCWRSARRDGGNEALGRDAALK
jgi:hypothetical protein